MAIKIVSSAKTEWQQAITRGSFEQRRKPLGGEKMQAGLWELAPGKRSFPFHVHHVTEECMFVISGRGKVRGSDGEHAIESGDYVSFPVGTAHQLINDGAEPLVYLAMSAIQGSGVDIVEYPDSNKVGCRFGEVASPRRMLFRAGDAPDYFEGEE